MFLQFKLNNLNIKNRKGTVAWYVQKTMYNLFIDNREENLKNTAAHEGIDIMNVILYKQHKLLDGQQGITS